MLPIYCEHFGLTREPFNVTPDPSFLYFTMSHREALAQLLYGIRSRRGFVVLTGEVGTGKTTLIRALLDEINDGQTRSAFLFDVTSPRDLLRMLCHEFGLASPLERDNDVQDYLVLLNGFLVESYEKNDNVVVILDEAQNLSAPVLERVRLLSNFETKQDKLLQILLVGQPELGNRLNQPELRQLKQRVALRHHLSPLSAAECKEYIAKRLEMSGGAASLFTEGAIRAVHLYSAGMPRLVNILCDNGLLSAYAFRKPSVEAAMIEEIAQDLHLTAPRQSSQATRESAAARPREAALRDMSPGVFDLTEAAVVERQERVGTMPPAAIPVRRPEAAVEKSTAVRPAIDSLKQSGNGEMRRTAPMPPSIVPGAFFESMTRALTEAMGPMAAFIVEDQIAAMGESKSWFPMRRVTQLVDEACREIASDFMKARFRQRMSNEIQAISGGEKKNSHHPS